MPEVVPQGMPEDTLAVRKMLLKAWSDLVNNRITTAEASAQARLAFAAMETLKLEIMAARAGLTEYKPIRLLPSKPKPDAEDAEIIEG